MALDTDTYRSFMVKFISDNTKFEKNNFSFDKHTLKIEDKVNDFLRKLKDSNLISSELYSKLFCSGSSPGISCTVFLKFANPFC